ncbi:PREDICTED: uncharacterized protein LOC108361527 [Rhagoletis zephyria]|uniref:uncharacterized protein LOC108361527 n=1 Tax=Rhagoletis zephyria TaxID=28612 RepID=UPI000811307D|nr:PREDICTED: uncharacterized protein LOC108361527 [Rhagoletis zephyria]
MEIGGRIELDEASIIDYFIEGIADSRVNKAILYQARSINELKLQMRVYEKVRGTENQKSKPFSGTTVGKNDEVKKERKCFRCGSEAHLAKECTHSQVKCFNCSQFGHKSFECKSVKKEQKPKQNTANTVDDWGCNLCLMRYGTLKNSGMEVQFKLKQKELYGIGGYKINTIGSFQTKIEMDFIVLDLKFYLIRDEDISYAVIICNVALEVADLIVTKEQAEFKAKRVDTEKDKITKSDMDNLDRKVNKGGWIRELDTVYAVCEDVGLLQELKTDHLPVNLAKEIRELVNQYVPANKVKPQVEMKILLRDELPVYQAPRRLSYENQAFVEKQISEWLDEKIIQPSVSEYATPIVLVSKKDGNSDEEFADARSTGTLEVYSIKKSRSLSFLEDFLGFDDPPYVTTSSPNINFFQNNHAKMATPEQKKSFISLCASIIRENYSGDPLSLASFIDKITLIEELSDESLTTTFIAFLKSKLEGKARESLPTQISSVSQIKEALSNKIKPDNSKVVAGKIAAMKVHNNNYSDFAKQVEELADSLERSLIIEGMTQAKAHEMAVEQTINVCRLNSRSDMVKSILASSTFSDSKDVVAKMIVEHDNIIKERQVLAFRSRSIRTNNF